MGESFSLGASVTPSNAANKNLAYSSSNSSVAVFAIVFEEYFCNG